MELEKGEHLVSRWHPIRTIKRFDNEVLGAVALMIILVGVSWRFEPHADPFARLTEAALASAIGLYCVLAPEQTRFLDKHLVRFWAVPIGALAFLLSRPASPVVEAVATVTVMRMLLVSLPQAFVREAERRDAEQELEQDLKQKPPSSE